jgi:uracil-DNA glycosylase
MTCTACDLAGPATQTVFGTGARHARVMLVGEQPGDKEDLQGLPFVGPAGRLLDDALDAAGIDRTTTYVTNAVKHFRFESVRGGKQRLHKTPTTTQIRICHPWLRAEIDIIRPELIVALGATAAKALRGPTFRITQTRGEILDHDGVSFLATVHPSAVLRAQDRKAAFADFVRDLEVAAKAL